MLPYKEKHFDKSTIQIYRATIYAPKIWLLDQNPIFMKFKLETYNSILEMQPFYLTLKRN